MSNAIPAPTSPDQQISLELLGKIVDEVFDGAIEDASVIEDIYAAIKKHEPPAPADHVPGLSEWTGWDNSRPPWSEAKHQDAVCAAVFGPTWAMEDAAALIGFIDRTWGRALSRDVHVQEHGDG